MFEKHDQNIIVWNENKNEDRPRILKIKQVIMAQRSRVSTARARFINHSEESFSSAQNSLLQQN